MSNLLSRIKIVPAVVPTAGAIAACTATEVDGTNYDRAMFVLETGAAGAGATIDFKVQKAPATGMAGAHDITGAAFTQLTAAASASKTFAIDLQIDPAHPIMKVVAEVKVGTFANGCSCILYNGSGLLPRSGSTTESIIV